MSEIKPALTAEQWSTSGFGVDLTDTPDVETWHAIAALALHGQPFGFTWDDVDILRRASVAVSCYRDPELEDEFRDSDGSVLDRLADRIAALLPPREATP